MGTPFFDALRAPEQAFEDFLLEQGAKGGLSGDVLNALGGALRGTRNVPTTRTRTTHALTLRIAGRVVGGIHKFSPKQRRALDREAEVEANNFGVYNEVVGGMLEGTFTMSRYDMYLNVLEEVTGSRELVLLTDQSRGFTVRETWRGPAGVLGGGVRSYEYYNCWLEDVGRDYDTDDDRVVRASASGFWTGRQRVR